jgi:Domain of unknown function (DUF4118)
VAGFALLNYYFTEPCHTFAMSRPDNVVALTVFVAVAAAISAVVGLAARRSRDAARSGADAELLFYLAGSVLRGEHALTALLGRLRETFAQESVTLLERRPGAPVTPDRQRDPGCWQVAAAVGGRPAPSLTRVTPISRSARTWRWCCEAGPCLPRASASPRHSPPRPPPRWAGSGWPRKPSRPAPSPRPTSCGRPADHAQS